MSLQALPCRRVASPSMIPAEISRLPAAPPRLWPSLSPETQAQISRIFAELLQRMLPTDVTAGTEISGVDRRNRR
jgi:hypothetical protein